MTQEPEPTGDRLARLTELAESLLREVQGLAEDSGEQFVSLAQRAHTNRLLIKVTIAGCALIALLTATLGIGLVGVVQNAERINELTHRLDVSQTETRRKALCPLYQVFLDSKSPEARTQAPDPEKYDQAFKVIEDGYKVLNCASFNEDSDTWTSPKG